MAVNEFLHWDQGSPFQGVQTTNDPVEMLYWDQGFPYQFVFTTTVTGSSTAILKVASVIFASAVNKISGVSYASINKVAGVD